MDNIFGSRIFFPQWGPFWILQKGHYGLRKGTEEGKLILARRRGRWGNQEPAPSPCPETHMPVERVCTWHVANRMGGGTIPLPTDITAEGPKNAPSAPPPKLVSHVTLDSCQLIHTSVLLHGQKRDLRQFIGLFKPETHSCFG